MSDRSTGIGALHQRIPFLLSQLGIYLAEDFVHRLEPFGLEPRAYAVLKALSEDDGRSQRELSTQLGIHRTSDRTIMLFTDEENIREVIAFPKNQRGADLMFDAPSNVDAEQLEVVGLALKPVVASTD